MWKFEEEHPFALAYRLVEEGKLDPWDVDICTLARAYMEEIKKLELLDLRVPARAVLTASFLLKKQVEVLFPQSKQRKERKKLTLQEIIQQFESQQQELSQKLETVKRAVRKIGEGKERKRRKERKFPIHLSRFEDALLELRELFRNGGKTFSFRELLVGKSLVSYLMALMMLYQEGLVELFQEKPYGDIKIIPVVEKPCLS